MAGPKEAVVYVYENIGVGTAKPPEVGVVEPEIDDGPAVVYVYENITT